MKIFYECQMEILYACIMNIQTAKHNSMGERFTLVYSYICIFVIVVIIPFIQIYLVFLAKPEDLKSDEIKQIFGNLY